MGPAPKKNIVPAHSGPEEALVKLYKLYRDRPACARKPGRQSASRRLPPAGRVLDRQPRRTLRLSAVGHVGQRQRGAVDPRGALHHGIRPRSTARMGRLRAGLDPRIRPARHRRARREGHPAGDGIAAAAYENGNADYIATAKRWWDDMAGKKLFVTAVSGQCISTKSSATTTTCPPTPIWKPAPP